jgi:hypothetical protein
MKKLTVVALTSLLALSGAAAEDLNKSFQKVTQLVNEKKYTKALEELSWMKKEIETLNNAHLKTFLPEAVLEYKGGNTESNSAMGFMTIKRTYKNGEKAIDVELTGGSSAGNGNPFGSIAAFGKMAAMMGVQGDGNDSFRIEGRTATSEDNGSPKVSVFLDSGSILAISANSGTDLALLRKFAESLPIVKIDDYLRGQG